MSNEHNHNRGGPVYVYGHRRIVKVGHSHTVTLPPAWLEKNREEQDHDSTQRD